MDQNQQQDPNNPMGQPMSGQNVPAADPSQPASPMMPADGSQPTAQPETLATPVEPTTPQGEMPVGSGVPTAGTGENPSGGQTPPPTPTTA